MKLWQGSFSADDFRRIEYIKRVHGQLADAEAVRYAVRETEARLAGPVTTLLRSAYDQAAAYCADVVSWRRANKSRAAQSEAADANAGRRKLTRWSFRCEEEDTARMDRIADHHGVGRGQHKRAAAVRFALYVQATLDGYVNRRRQHERAAAS